MAMPICSLAAPERRCRKCERRRRLADQHSNGVLVLRSPHHDIGRLHTRGIELSFCLRDIRLGRGAAFEASSSQLQRVAVGFYGIVEQALLRIGGTEFEVVEGKLGMETQVDTL